MIAGKRHKMKETINDIAMSVLNEMVDAVNEVTAEADIYQIYESVEDFIQDKKEEPESLRLQNFFKKLKEKITSYAKLQGRNQIKILANFYKFISKIKRQYEALVECFNGSIVFLMIFSSKEGYDLYKKDIERGRIGEQILELFLYPPFVNSFGLKADDVKISLNDRLLTKHKGKEKVCSNAHLLYVTLNTGIMLHHSYFRFVLVMYTSFSDMEICHLYSFNFTNQKYKIHIDIQCSGEKIHYSINSIEI